MALSTEEKCPSCGSRNVNEGVLDNATMRMKGKVFASSSIIARVCGDCGTVFKLRVAKPQMFSRRENG